MPLTTEKRGDKYRVIEKDTREIAVNGAGTAIDGGGHETHGQAVSQVHAVGVSEGR